MRTAEERRELMQHTIVLLADGCSDLETARILRVPVTTVRHWRLAMGRPVDRLAKMLRRLESRGRHGAATVLRRMAEQGCTNEEIALEVGCGVQLVWRLRNMLGLPRNAPGRRPGKRAARVE